MNKLMRALRSEQRRLWYKRSTIMWIILTALLSAFIVFVCAASINYVNYDFSLWTFDTHFTPSITQTAGDDWKSDAQQTINESYDRWNELADIIENGSYIQRSAALREREISARESHISTYRIENGISPAGGGMWRMIQFAIWLLMPLVCCVSCIAASDMFAGEYSRGTIYMNLARPVTRIKQYFAKIFTAWFYGTLLMLAAFLGSILAGALLLGDDGGIYVGCINGEVYSTSWLKHCLAVLGCCTSTVIITITLCAALGTLTRSRAVSALGASAAAFIAVWLGRFIAPSLGLISGLSIFSCLDLTAPLMQAAYYPNLSFADCCVSCGTHLLIFFISGYYFMRRDINS